MKLCFSNKNSNPQSKGGAEKKKNLNLTKAVARGLIYSQVNFSVYERFPAQLLLQIQAL